MTMIMNIKNILLFLTLTTFCFSESENQKLITVHAEDANLSTILAILAQESGYNIVTGPMVNQEDRLTIHIDKTPVEQAINLVVRASGLSYEIVGNSILVAQKEKLAEEIGISPHVIELQYATADEVMKLLENVTENIRVDKSGNKLLINTNPKKISEIKDIVKKVDIPALQIMLEARLIEVAISEEQKLGIDWARLAQITTIVVENAAPLDLPGGINTGSLYPGSSYGFNENGEIVPSVEPEDANILPDNKYFQRINPSNRIGFSRQMSAFDITLDLLLKDNKAEVLANSKVVTLNGHEASISMVDIVPYILSTGGVGGQVQVQREEVGIKLNILPTINTDGFITTSITPEVSSIFDFIGPDRNIPWVKKRISNTTIRVKDGESIIIAGLLGMDKKFVKQRFPMFWRIPYIGERFFTHTVEQENKTDLIIQITPHIVKDNYTGIEKSFLQKMTEIEAFETNPSDTTDTIKEPNNENE